MTEPTDAPIRFSLRQLLGVMTYIAMTLSVVSYTGQIVFGVHLSILLFGWIARRFGRAHLGGLVLALLGTAALWGSSVIEISNASEDFLGFREFGNCMVIFLILIGLAILVWSAVCNPRFRNRQISVACTFLLLIVAWAFTIPPILDAAITRRQAEDNAANMIAMAKAVALVNDVQLRLGAAPTVGELTELLTEPLPRIRWDRRSTSIRYRRTSATTFELEFVFFDIFTYDSATPARGWVRTPF